MIQYHICICVLKSLVWSVNFAFKFDSIFAQPRNDGKHPSWQWKRSIFNIVIANLNHLYNVVNPVMNHPLNHHFHGCVFLTIPSHGRLMARVSHIFARVRGRKAWICWTTARSLWAELLWPSLGRSMRRFGETVVGFCGRFLHRHVMWGFHQKFGSSHGGFQLRHSCSIPFSFRVLFGRIGLSRNVYI